MTTYSTLYYFSDSIKEIDESVLFWKYTKRTIPYFPVFEVVLSSYFPMVNRTHRFRKFHGASWNVKFKLCHYPLISVSFSSLFRVGEPFAFFVLCCFSFFCCCCLFVFLFLSKFHRFFVCRFLVPTSLDHFFSLIFKVIP